MVPMLFRDPQTLGSDLTWLGSLQPRTFRSLNCIETSDSASNYCVETWTRPLTIIYCTSLIEEIILDITGNYRVFGS